MKSLVIENQWEVPEDLQSFIDQNPDAVGEVMVVVNALNRGTGELGATIAEHDQILVESTFYHKEQLETILHALHAGKFGPRIKRFGCMYLLRKLDEWTRPYKPMKNSFTILKDGTRVPDPERPGEYCWGARSGFEDHKLFLEHLIDLVESEGLQVYDITHDWRWRHIPTGKLMYFDTAKAQGIAREEMEVARQNDDEWVMLRIRYDRELRRFHYEGLEPDPDAYRY